MLALELIDAALVVARQHGDAVDVVADAPGVALLEDQTTVTGVDALQRLRVKPLLANTNFWRALSTQPLTRPSRVAGTTADVAFAQAEQLLGRFKGSESVLLAVPAGYTREQLGLLLGVINETGVRVAGLVDAALAACSLEPAPARVLHLDLELHQALLTVLEYSGGEHPGLKRSRYEIALRHGLLGIQQTLMQFIAENFVRKTRFDPLHEASSEQRLHDRLPAWLSELQQAETITLSFQFDQRELQLEMERGQLIAAAEPHYAELLRLVQGARVAGMAIDLRVSQRVASMPGLLDRLRTLRDCTIQVLPPAAAAWGALQYEASIRRAPDSLALVYQLPVSRAESGETQAPDFEATPPQLRPTHVLFQGRAWSIDEQPLTIGWAVEGRPRALTLPSALPGISRSHCTLVRRNGAVMIEDHSTYGSFVNDEKVVGRTALTVGDRLRLGSPGITLELIQLVNDDGAPQD
ncbi:FHA domain-containing protein [Steroidobacter sp. S1-65]|uniref:FHA domain-containing protein n=1 Tax=Steroidobacter gossypii TaxID=2805490 RepID=A0ABS1WU97_9GAMM|nr:FHA domain-containing protein [Steroidobacter gossypii]MBM0104528.1 FHA domain-containing protein [Steroidobacter gossypii]